MKKIITLCTLSLLAVCFPLSYSFADCGGCGGSEEETHDGHDHGDHDHGDHDHDHGDEEEDEKKEREDSQE